MFAQIIYNEFDSSTVIDTWPLSDDKREIPSSEIQSKFGFCVRSKDRTNFYIFIDPTLGNSHKGVFLISLYLMKQVWGLDDGPGGESGRSPPSPGNRRAKRMGGCDIMGWIVLNLWLLVDFPSVVIKNAIEKLLIRTGDLGRTWCMYSVLQTIWTMIL